MLNENQDKALDEIITWLSDPNSTQHCLIGYAGTGKSYLVSHLISFLAEADSGDRVCLTAPTNKAVKVLDELRTGCDTSTLHTLLGLRPKINEYTGKQYFERDYTLSNSPDKMSIEDYNLIVVDEAGMINSDLYEMLQGYKTKFLFLGDDAQLPPVGEKSSVVWDKVQSKSRLTEVVRYSGKILDLATHTRHNLTSRDRPLLRDFMGEGVSYLNPRAFTNRVLDEIEYAVEHNLPSHIRVLCYRNKAVSDWNSKIRATLYGGYDVPSFVEGEWLMANEPVTIPHPLYEGKRQTLIKNSDEFQIEGVAGVQNIEGIHCWQLLVRDNWIYVCDSTQEVQLGFTLTQMANNAKACEDKKQRAKLWREYWNLKEQFANCSYTHAITVNKSQGSTYTLAAVDTSDIYNCKQIEERNRRAYTAFTRPKAELLLY